MSSPRLFKQFYDINGLAAVGSTPGYGQTSGGVVVSVGTWIAPPGVKWVFVTGCGGGGGGGGGASTSSSNSASPLFIWYIACGGGGGQSAITSTQVVPVVPGVGYPISIGQGGAGANNTGFGVYNGVPTGTNQFGGVSFGNVGSQGAASIFGTVVFTGGLGGRRGEIICAPFAANEINGFVPGYDAVGGLNPYGSGAIPNNYNGVPNPPAGLASSPYTADAVALQGAINNSQSLVANAALPGLSRIFRANGLGGGGGGGGGGYSNNIYSVGGTGGQGAQGVNGYPFATGGANGTYGGGGGGGGGGEGLDYNNTHDGAGGGNGGSGFIEIAWMI